MIPAAATDSVRCPVIRKASCRGPPPPSPPPRFLLFHFAGIWLSAFALGNFVGPTVAGLAVDVIGFRRTTIIFFALYAAMAAFDAIEAIKQAARQRAASAYEELG